MKKKIVSIGLLLMVAVCSVLIGIFIATSLNLSPESKALPFWREGASSSPNHVLMPSLSTLAKSASPTVVNIRTTKKVMSQDLYKQFERPGGEGDWFDEFFRKFFDKLPQEDLQQKSLGSGFIISRDGYILTNNHVISEAEEIFVSLSDNEEYKASIVGKDDNTDIALIKIDSKKTDFPVAVLGDQGSREQQAEHDGQGSSHAAPAVIVFARKELADEESPGQVSTVPPPRKDQAMICRGGAV